MSLSLSFRVVKEEISDDSAKLPCFNGRVVSWVRNDKPVAYVNAVYPDSPADAYSKSVDDLISNNFPLRLL